MATTEQQILKYLDRAQANIDEAEKLVAGEGPPPPKTVAVNPGDNLLAMIADNPENTLFQVHDEFVQDCGQVELAKPCTLRSTHARLIAILNVKPQTHFLGMTIDGATNGTILTGADGVTLDGCTLNGNPAGQHRGILANCKGMRVRTTKILNIARDIDTQAIAGWNKTDDLQVTNCQLEASGENFLLGGETSESEAAMPRNVTLTGCLINKRPEWRAGVATCKNLLELKVGENVTITNNVMDYSCADGQAGYGIVMTVRNEYGLSPWSIIKNVQFEGNTIKRVAGGFQIMGRDDRGPNYQSRVMTGVTIKGNMIEELSSRYGGNQREVFISGGPDRLTLDGNSFACPDVVVRRSGSETPHSALCFDQPEHVLTNFVVRDQVQFVEGVYGIFGTSAPGLGTPALAMYAPGYVWENNRVLKSGSNISWPPGTIFI